MKGSIMVYAVLDKNGEVFVATDIQRVKGNELVYRAFGEFDGLFESQMMDLAESGEIYNPGNGQLVGVWTHEADGFGEQDDMGFLHVRFLENSGDLRQETNNMLLEAVRLRRVGFRGAELITVKWREAGAENAELRSFSDIIENYKAPNRGVEDISDKYRYIKLEGVFDNKVVCETVFDVCTRSVSYIELFNISAESVNEVFKYLGKCKYIGNNVDTLAITNGESTNFLNWYKYTKLRNNDETVYVVRVGRGKDNLYIFNKEEYKRGCKRFYDDCIDIVYFYVTEYTLKDGTFKVTARYREAECSRSVDL